jgi:phosphatidylglycerol lysyltransferase
MRERLVGAIGPALGLGLFAAALWVLHREFEHFDLQDVIGHLREIRTDQLVLSTLLSAISYLLLTGYDTLAMRYIEKALAWPRIALASFVSYVFSHNLGILSLDGSLVRYRMLSSFGLAPGEIARVIAFDTITFWLGFLALGGVLLIVTPLGIPPAFHLGGTTTRPVGVVLFLALVAYLAASVARRAPIVVRGFALSIPKPGMTLAQVAISSADWAFSAAVLWVLLPPVPGLSFAVFVSAYLLSVVAGLVSHVPGGVGVFETALVLALARYLPGDVVLSAALAYRLVYYLAPMALALLLFSGYELTQRRAALARTQDVFAAWAPELVPRAFAAASFAAGVILLFSGATPAEPDRMDLLEGLLPLSVVELSHFLGSLAGVGLLLLARALQRRLDGAYYATLVLLAGGALVSLLKGFDYEEALVLSTMFTALVPCKRFFTRKSSLIEQSFSLAWTARLVFVLAATAFLVALAYREVEYSHELWWQFELSAHASRSLRALVGAVGLLGFAALVGLFRPARARPSLPKPDEIEQIRPLVAAAPRSSAHLALVGDKSLLVHEDGTAFLMYGVQGRTWIAMGDPVGREDARRELAWRFRELADESGGRAVFYEVGAEELPLYLDLGLSPQKLGEEARVRLSDFSLAGGGRKALRASHNRAVRDGGSFEILPAVAVPGILDELEAISEAWLAAKRTREKRFSVGRFDRAYLARLPMAVIRQHGRIVAFANVWPGGEKYELSIDLMRQSDDAPPGVMDYLFCELMLWGRAEGYAWFSLGVAPLSGLDTHRFAPLWNRAGALLFQHGEEFYNFQGLRAFKDKFDPVWEPRYLAAASGLTLPFALRDVTALIAGGIAGVVAK